ncbi:neurexin-1-like protein, partial [Dinothrombium tinctorium]
STAYEFGDRGGLITYTYPIDRRPDTKNDHLAVGFITKRDNAVLFRIDSGFSIDFMEMQILDGNILMIYNLGTIDHEIRDLNVKVNDDKYHIVRFTRSGPNSTIQVDNYKVVTKYPSGKQLTMLNSHAKLRVGGRKNSVRNTIEMPFHGIVSGLVFNGHRLLELAAENDPRITIEGDVKLLIPTSGSAKYSKFNSTTKSSLIRNPPQMQQPKGSNKDEDELIISGAGSGCYDDDECSAFTDSGSGDDLITPVYISPKTTLAPPTYHKTSTMRPKDLENKICDDEEEEDCFDGSGSGESINSKAYEIKSNIPSTPPTRTEWSTPSHVRRPPVIVPTVDYDDKSILHTSKPIPPPAPPPYQTGRTIRPPRPALPPRPTGTPIIYTIDPPILTPITKETKKQTTTYSSKTSAYRTALVIGLIAILLIVIVIIAPIVVFIKVKYRTGGIFKTGEGKNFQFTPVSGTPPLLGSGSQQTHINGMPSRASADQKAPKLPKKKNLKEWYV